MTRTDTYDRGLKNPVRGFATRKYISNERYVSSDSRYLLPRPRVRNLDPPARPWWTMLKAGDAGETTKHAMGVSLERLRRHSPRQSRVRDRRWVCQAPGSYRIDRQARPWSTSSNNNSQAKYILTLVGASSIII
jgi:hypothetical protein